MLIIDLCCLTTIPIDYIVESGSTNEQDRCPVGTHSNRTMLFAESECTDCTEGYYCETPGLTEPTGPCDEGSHITYKYYITGLTEIYLSASIDLSSFCIGAPSVHIFLKVAVARFQVITVHLARTYRMHYTVKLVISVHGVVRLWSHVIVVHIRMKLHALNVKSVLQVSCIVSHEVVPLVPVVKLGGKAQVQYMQIYF